MPNMMVALPNIRGALSSAPQSLADAHYYLSEKLLGIPRTVSDYCKAKAAV